MDSLTELISYFLYQWAKNIGIVYHLTLIFIMALTVLLLRARYLTYQATACSNYYSQEMQNRQSRYQDKLRANKFLIILLGLIAAIYLIFVFFLNQVFLKSWLHYQLEQIAKRVDAEIEYTSLSGNIITGKFVINDFEIHLNRRGKQIIDLKIPKFTMHMINYRFPGQKLLYQEINLGEITAKVRNRRLKYLKLPKIEQVFSINSLSAKNAILLFYGYSAKPDILIVNDLKSNFLSSAEPEFDLIFASNINGKLNEKPFKIQHQLTGKQHLAEWHFDEIPIKMLKKVLYFGVVSWLDKGSVNLAAKHKWRDGDNKLLSTQWQVTTHGLKIEVPRALSLTEKLQYIAFTRTLSEEQPYHTFKLQSDLVLHKKNIANDYFGYVLNKSLQEGLNEYLKRQV